MNNYFEILFPDEILINIFSYFDLTTRMKMVTTCKRWYRLIIDPRYHLKNIGKITFKDESVQLLNAPSSVPSGYNDIDEFKTLATHLGRRCELVELKPMHDDGTFLLSIFNVFNQECFRIESIYLTYAHTNLLPIDHFPTHIRSLYIHGYRLDHWPEFLNLEYLCLREIYLPTELVLPSTLLVLKFYCRMNENPLTCLFEHLDNCKNLEELEIGSVFIIPNAFQRLIHTIRDVLLKLTKLTFNEVSFPDLELETIVKQNIPKFVYRNTSPFSSLEETGFGAYDGRPKFYHTINGFIRICYLKTIFIDAKINDMIHIYELSSNLFKKGTKLKLRLGYPTFDSESNFYYQRSEIHTPPLEFSLILTELRLHTVNHQPLITSIFDLHTYPELKKIEFVDCQGLYNSILIDIAKKCPNLENIIIKSCKKINEYGLLPFLRYWNELSTNRLTIECVKNQFSIHDLATLIGLGKNEERCILDDGKLVRIYEKILPCNNWKKGTRLEIRQEEKLLIIKNYLMEDLDYTFSFVIPRKRKE